MREAVESPSVRVPHFETREEFHKWIENLTEVDFK